MERTRSGAYQPFASISLPDSPTRDSALVYARGEQQRPEHLIREAGSYGFSLGLEEAASSGGIIDRLWQRRPQTVSFERDRKNDNARAFNTATLPLGAPGIGARP